MQYRHSYSSDEGVRKIKRSHSHSPRLESVAYFGEIYENNVAQGLGSEGRDAHLGSVPVLPVRVKIERGGFGRGEKNSRHTHTRARRGVHATSHERRKNQADSDAPPPAPSQENERGSRVDANWLRWSVPPHGGGGGGRGEKLLVAAKRQHDSHQTHREVPHRLLEFAGCQPWVQILSNWYILQYTTAVG